VRADFAAVVGVGAVPPGGQSTGFTNSPSIVSPAMCTREMLLSPSCARNTEYGMCALGCGCGQTLNKYQKNISIDAIHQNSKVRGRSGPGTLFLVSESRSGICVKDSRG
jgi:hypothetical protein